MIIGNINELQGKKLESDLVKNALMKVLVSPNEGWDGYVMRVVELGKDGFTPKHSHDWPHINYVIEGDGEILIGENYTKVNSGSFAFVPNNTLHQYRNTSDKVFKFICIVPEIGHKM